MHDYDAIAAVIAQTMTMIRDDVARGLGPNIEADAIAMDIGDNLARYFKSIDPAFDSAAFLSAADLLDPIPSEAFHDF
jgi:hypothetical protein